MGAALECSIEIPVTLPDDHPGEPGAAVPGGQGGTTVAGHALYTADQAKHVANMAAAVAFTAIAGGQPKSHS
jgi:hypothetical protein